MPQLPKEQSKMRAWREAQFYRPEGGTAAGPTATSGLESSIPRRVPSHCFRVRWRLGSLCQARQETSHATNRGTGARDGASTARCISPRHIWPLHGKQQAYANSCSADHVLPQQSSSSYPRANVRCIRGGSYYADRSSQMQRHVSYYGPRANTYSFASRPRE